MRPRDKFFEGEDMWILQDYSRALVNSGHLNIDTEAKLVKYLRGRFSDGQLEDMIELLEKLRAVLINRPNRKDPR